MAKESYITQEDVDILSKYMDAVDKVTKKVALPVSLIAEGGTWFLVDMVISALIPAPAKFINKIIYKIGKVAIAWCVSEWVGQWIYDDVQKVSTDLKTGYEEIVEKVQKATEQNEEPEAVDPEVIPMSLRESQHIIVN